MNKDETIETLSQVIGALTVFALIAAGVKYAFNFTWFQAGMIVYLVESIRTRKG